MTGEGIRPSWKLLLLLGLIGGAPTFFGTALQQPLDRAMLAFIETSGIPRRNITIDVDALHLM